MWRIWTIAAGALFCVAGGEAHAYSQRDLKDCKQQEDGDRAIRGCTRLMGVRGLKAKHLSVLYDFRGMAYTNKGDYDAAISDFNESLRLDNDATIYYNRGYAYYLKGEYDAALDDVNQAIRMKPREAKYYSDRGYIYTGKGDHDQAIIDFNEAIRLKPYASSYLGRGYAYFGKGDHDRAIADYNEAMRMEPKSNAAYAYRAGVYHAKGEYGRAITDFTESLRLKATASSYLSRGVTYYVMGETGSAAADFAEAIRLKPDASTYWDRGAYYLSLGDYDSAIADLNEAIRMKPSATYFKERATAHQYKKDYSQAMADYNQALRLKPSAEIYVLRASLYNDMGDHDRAIADVNEAQRLSPYLSQSYNQRGHALCSKGEHLRGVADFNEAIRRYPRYVAAYVSRGKCHEALGDVESAKADYRAALAQTAWVSFEKQKQAEAGQRLAALEAPRPPAPAAAPVAPVATAAPAAANPGRRIALVIGNGAYAAVPRLANPTRDAAAMAAAFRRLGFAEVIELRDARYDVMAKALKDFGDKAASADWAVIYFAGHGIEIGGQNYLIPIDASLARASHADDEAIPLSRVQDKARQARKFGLIILDACRNNPFAAQVAAREGTRSVGRGLARVEPSKGVLIAYAARDGAVAEDGSGEHSPFAAALLAHIEQPGLEIGLFFRKVRDAVLAQTRDIQEPYVYGSLPGSEELYFKPPAGAPR